MSSLDHSKISVIGFDADDTLWVNETFFREAEDEFCQLMSGYETENQLRHLLFEFEMKNLGVYGYGVKGFILSLVECALSISQNKVSPETIGKILDIGKDMLNKPVDVLEHVEKVLAKLEGKYRILLLTKGDLLDQERKLEKSGLSKYFHHVEVLSDKKEKNYQELLDHLDIKAENFLMIGNSVKSDVLPIINIGAQAVHIPFHTTWVHEEVSEKIDSNYLVLRDIVEILDYLK